MESNKYHTIILGGGFVGLFTALHLSHQKYNLPTLLIDQSWSFTFKPLLYEFLSGEMNVELIWARYDYLLKNSHVGFVRDTIETIDVNGRIVYLRSGLSYQYEKLVLCLGSVNSYLGVSGAEQNTFGFRSPEDVMSLGKHLRDSLQLASQTEDSQLRQQILTFVILGAGRAGVELAVTLADLLPEWYEPIGGNIAEIKVIVVQRGSEILKGDSAQLRHTALQSAQKRKVPVEFILEADVKAVQPNQVEYLRHGQTEILIANTIVWTTGTDVNPLIKQLPVKIENRDKHGKLYVNSYLQLPEYPEVFAGGDCVICPEHPLPATAQVAYQQGANIAHNLKAASNGHPLIPVNIKLRGTLIKLGLDESAAEIFDKYEFKGKLGHLIRQATYVDLLPTPVRNFKATTHWLSDEIFHRIGNI